MPLPPPPPVFCRHPQLSSLECRVSELESQRDAARDGADTLTQEVDALKTMLKAAQEGTDNGCESGGGLVGHLDPGGTRRT